MSGMNQILIILSQILENEVRLISINCSEKKNYIMKNLNFKVPIFLIFIKYSLDFGLQISILKNSFISKLSNS